MTLSIQFPDITPRPEDPQIPVPEPDAHSTPITDHPSPGEYGAHAFGRKLATHIARSLNTPVTALIHRENPWDRRACPHAQFWDLTAAGHEIRVTGYETPAPRSSGTYSAYAIHLDGQPVPFRRAPVDRLEIQLAYAIWSAHFDLPEHAHHTTHAETGSDSGDPGKSEPSITPLRVWTCTPCGYTSTAPRVDRDALHLRTDNTHPPSWHTPDTTGDTHA